MERKITAAEIEMERLEDNLPSSAEALPSKTGGRKRWRKIFYRSGLTTLALAAGLSAGNLLHRESRADAAALSHNGNCEIAVQVVGVRFINRVGDPDVLDQGDEIVGRAGNFTASIQTPSGEALRTVFVGSDGVANTPRFNRRCDTTGINGQPAVSLRLRTDQSSRVLDFNVEDHNARRVFVGREAEGGVALVPTPVIPVATPTRTPDGGEGERGGLPADWWKWVLGAAAVIALIGIGAWGFSRYEAEERRRRATAPPPDQQPPDGPQPQPVQPPPGGAPPPVADHERQAIQQEIGALRRDLTAHGHRIQNVEATLGHHQPQRGAEAQAVAQEPAVQPAPRQPQAEAEAQAQPQAQVVPEARRGEHPPRRAEARVRGRERLRKAKRVDTWIDPELAEQLARIEAAESREQPRVPVDVEEGRHEESGRGV